MHALLVVLIVLFVWFSSCSSCGVLRALCLVLALCVVFVLRMIDLYCAGSTRIAKALALKRHRVGRVGHEFNFITEYMASFNSRRLNHMYPGKPVNRRQKTVSLRAVPNTWPYSLLRSLCQGSGNLPSLFPTLCSNTRVAEFYTPYLNQLILPSSPRFKCITYAILD